MTAAVPAQRAAPQMTHTPDPTATSQADAVASPAGVESTRPRLREQVAENLLLSLLGGLLLALLTFFGTVVVALFIFNLNSINDRLDSIEGRIDRLETKMDEGFAAQGAQIAELDARLTAQIAELDARLTAQITELDARLTAQIAELDARLTAQITELDRKMTALTAHLNATEAVEAALEHRLLTPDAGTTEPEGKSPG